MFRTIGIFLLLVLCSIGCLQALAIGFMNMVGMR